MSFFSEEWHSYCRNLVAMMKRRQILVLDYSLKNTLGPHSASMYDCLAKRYELTFINVPRVPLWRRALMRTWSFSLNRGTWARRYWGAMEKYQFSPSCYRSTTQDYTAAVAEFMKTRPVDLIFQYGAMFGPVQQAASMPYITYHDGNMWITRHSPCHQAEYLSDNEFRDYFQLEQQLVQRAARVLTYSHKTRESYVRDYKCSNERVVAVGSSDWVRRQDTAWLQDLLTTDSAKVMSERDPNLVLFIHSDFRRKGGQILLNAFQLVVRQLPAAKLLIAGPNPELAHGQNVFATGPIRDRAELLRLYRQGSLFVLPSLNDPFPRVLFEAMIHRLPCIGSRVGGIPEQIVDGQTGYLVEPGNEADLARHIIRLLKCQDKAREMGQAGFRHLVNNYLPDSVARRVSAQIEAACN